MIQQTDQEPGRDTSTPVKKPIDFALRRLSRRSHSKGELVDKMERTGYSYREIEATINYLRKYKYIDDTVFAIQFAQSRSKFNYWGPTRISHRLQELKLQTADIQKALEETFPEGENQAARRAFHRYLEKRNRKKTVSEQQGRAYRHLLSRGFSGEVSHELVSTYDFGDTEPLENRSRNRYRNES